MSKVILQPASSESSQVHFNNTISQSISLQSISSHLSSTDINQLTILYPNNDIKIWGVAPGVNNVNFNKWNKVQKGDIVLFFKKGGVFAKGIVTCKIRNYNLANQLWGNINSITWECIFFVDEVELLNIGYSDFNQLIGYNPNYVVQGFNILNDELSDLVINTYDFSSSININPYSVQSLISTANQITTTDLESKSYRRLEQGVLRQILFGNHSTVKCGICGKEYPTTFLVAAHIKKRALCDLNERLDLNNIAIPMCKFGCDELYEKGFILVQNGEVILNPKKPIHANIMPYMGSLVGKTCNYFNPNTKPYFDYHNSMF